jgi:thiol:disulfide interchange protein
MRFAAPRDLALASSLPLLASIVLDKIGSRGRYENFFVGVLFGLGIGLAVFALGAYWRSRARG